MLEVIDKGLDPRREKNNTADAVAMAQTAAAMPMWMKLRLSRPNIGPIACGS